MPDSKRDRDPADVTLLRRRADVSSINAAERERRTFRGPDGAEVFVPPRPADADSRNCDLPPGFPPELRYRSMVGNYWVAVDRGLRTGFDGEPVDVEPELMRWLEKIRPDVEEIARGV